MFLVMIGESRLELLFLLFFLSLVSDELAHIGRRLIFAQCDFDQLAELEV